MGLAGFISKIVQSITRTTFKFNKTLDDLISKFKDSCPSTQELRSLIIQKNAINGALEQIQGKIATLNTVAETSEVVVKGVKAGVTIIKLLPIPTSVPPGIGIPVSVINMFSDALDTLGTLIDKEEGSLDAIPEALNLISKDVSEVISKLNEFDAVLNNCLEKDPNITQQDINSLSNTTGNFMGVLTNDELGEILSNPPGLLYGDYYLRLNFINTEVFSFDQKQVTAQNKESVPPPGDYYMPGAPIEILYGDESFSSSNIVLVDEMKWHIDIKDLTFPPPPPAEDPLKTYSRIPQTTILKAIFGVDSKQADELYEIAWDLSQQTGWWYWKYDDIVEDAFNNSRSVLEQSVAFIGERWERGEIVLDRDIETTFLGNIVDEDEKDVLISQIKSDAYSIRHKANEVGGDFDYTDRKWENENIWIDDGAFNDANPKIRPYSLRVAQTAANLYDDAQLILYYPAGKIAQIFDVLRKRRLRWQSVYDAAYYLSKNPNPKFIFTDPLSAYYQGKGVGYTNAPSSAFIYGPNAQIHNFVLQIINVLYKDNPDYNNGQVDKTSAGKTFVFQQLFHHFPLDHKINGVISDWWNKFAQITSEYEIWSGVNDPNNNISQTAPDYFEFGKSGLPIPTG